MHIKILIYLLISVGVFCLINTFSLSYSFNDLKDYMNVLLSISGMVFTIMGIWIAFLYPNALSRIVNPEKIETADFTESLQETKRLEKIVGSVLKSALVMSCVMSLFLLKIILESTSFYQSHNHLLKTLALTAIVLISYLQLEAVAQVVNANIRFINDLHQKRVIREEDQI